MGVRVGNADEGMRCCNLFLLAAMVLSVFCMPVYAEGKNDVKKLKKMDLQLYELAEADIKDRKGIADRYGLEFKRGKVLVVIQVSETEEALALDALKKYNINIIRQYRNFIKAFVYIDDLKPLAQEQAVQFIRKPDKPVILKNGKR